jgi:hypothetical protein
MQGILSIYSSTMVGSPENKKGADESQRPGGADHRVIKEGGYQPTTDPGEVPEILVDPDDAPNAPPPKKTKSDQARRAEPAH